MKCALPLVLELKWNNFFPVPAKIIDRENDCVDGRDPTAIRRGTFGKLLVEFEKFGRSPV